MGMIAEIFTMIYGFKIGPSSLMPVIELLNGVLFLFFIDEESEIQEIMY